MKRVNTMIAFVGTTSTSLAGPCTCHLRMLHLMATVTELANLRHPMAVTAQDYLPLLLHPKAATELVRQSRLMLLPQR
jgi:hypothetical protein